VLGRRIVIELGISREDDEGNDKILYQNIVVLFKNLVVNVSTQKRNEQTNEGRNFISNQEKGRNGWCLPPSRPCLLASLATKKGVVLRDFVLFFEGVVVRP
jgi:hypothetical protein